MQYTIWIASPAHTYTHSECFREVAESLRAAFVELGYGCEITKSPPIFTDNVVILGAHLLHPDDMILLNNPIVWQLEQIPADPSSRPWMATYLEVLRKATIWDYSRANIETLKGYGVEARLLEVGYMPCLTRIENVSNPDIDILFIGSLNERRKHILQELIAKGVKVVHAFDCYGLKRDALIARAKVVLNVHFYESKIWEIVRCSYLLSNRKCIVSETGFDKSLESLFYEGVVFTEYSDVVARCLDLLAGDDSWSSLAQKGFDIMSGRGQMDFLREVLA